MAIFGSDDFAVYHDEYVVLSQTEGSTGNFWFAVYHDEEYVVVSQVLTGRYVVSSQTEGSGRLLCGDFWFA